MLASWKTTVLAGHMDGVMPSLQTAVAEVNLPHQAYQTVPGRCIIIPVHSLGSDISVCSVPDLPFAPPWEQALYLRAS